MKTTNPGLLAVEYLFVALSMVGIAVATFTQEITCAAIPLMITLLMNLFNRQQVEENIQLLEQKLSEEKPEINQVREDVDYSFHFRAIEAKIQDSEQAITQLKEERAILANSFAPKEIQSQLMDVQTTLSNWQNRLDALNSVDLSAIQQDLSNLHHRLDSLAQLQSEIPQIKQNYQTLENRFQDYQKEINNLANLIQSLPKTSNLEELQQQIYPLNYLKTEVNNLVNRESFNELSSQLNNLFEQFNQRPETETIQALSQEVKNISESLANLDFNIFGEQIKKLREQFEAIPQKDLVETLSNQKEELKEVKQEMEELEEQISSNQSKNNPLVKKRLLKSKPRRVRIKQRRR